MRSKYYWRKSNQKIVPDNDSFTGKDREDNKEKFFADEGHKKLWERLDETKKRLPWIQATVDSLEAYIEKNGTLTDNQKSFATSLFIDACVTSDDRLFEQVETRKLGYRLMKLELGRVRSLVTDIMFRTNTRPFSLGQMRAFNNIAKRQIVKLTQIPKLTDETFDGWNLIEPETKLDK